MLKVKKPIFFLVIFISSWLLSSCAWESPRVLKYSFKKGKHVVNIIKRKPNGQYPSKRPLEHPHNFKGYEMFNTLMSLKYKKIALFSLEKKIFHGKLAKEIAPLLVKAFNKASKRDIIEFDVQSPNGRILGDVFISRKKINWVFRMVNGASYEKNNSRDYLDSWKLVLRKGQKYHGEKELFGIRIAKNWIIYPVNKTFGGITPSGKHQKSEPSENIFEEFNEMDSSDLSEIPTENGPNINPNIDQKEIETQFRRLKSLMQKGLITQEEYKTKKKKLLEKYF